MTEYEVEAIKAAIERYIRAGLQHKDLRDNPHKYDGPTRQKIEAEAVSEIYAFAGVLTGYGYVQIDGIERGICKDCYIVHRDYVQNFRNGLYNMYNNQWHGDLVAVPSYAVIPIRFTQEAMND